ncbi:single-stranded DNA-binding protein [Ligilactobacillus equi]|uniref:Single-stranded DNA binding protein (Ssb) n=2 Tax=Ligilactobacillus equi TaxID=137357 RepID=V7HX96_9LACO|nr:single-stranded DNA-binding protein [Ligilactobacillus equi]ETA74517.1 single-stranded DNA binding protein (Ssb) [Ligilactobacillus equi DPC 6820]KRL84302.1 hypothetical protein FC36_GL000225 [Ligilactobacillus equi DSM 15833 = JCM 10991]
MSTNITVLQGRLVRNPEIRNVENRQVMSFRIAVQRNFKNRNGEYDSDFFNIETWNAPSINYLSTHIMKGTEVIVTGTLRATISGEGDKRREYINVQAENVSVTHGAPASSPAMPGAMPNGQGQFAPQNQGFNSMNQTTPVAPNANNFPQNAGQTFNNTNGFPSASQQVPTQNNTASQTAQFANSNNVQQNNASQTTSQTPQPQETTPQQSQGSTANDDTFDPMNLNFL